MVERGIVGLLEADQVGGLLVQVDTGDRLAGLVRLFEQRLAGIGLDPRLTRHRADETRQLTIGALVARTAPGQSIGRLQRG